MKKITLLIALIIICNIPSEAQQKSAAGAFSRLGFGARGMGMGNTLTAVTTGEIYSYYNPALSVFSLKKTASATFSLLSLDRYLNFISYSQPIPPRGGLSAGIINASVRRIDGRDNDGNHTQNYSTSENQFFLSFANQFYKNFSLGVSVKLYYAKLFEKITSTTVGFDFGFHYSITRDILIGGMLVDLGSKYRWDTSPIYGRDGKSSIDKFPTLRRIALAYKLPLESGIATVAFENSSLNANIIRFGVEYNIIEQFTIRSGFDRMALNNIKSGTKPSFGFSIKNLTDDATPIFTYAYIHEPYSPEDMHIITLSIVF